MINLKKYMNNKTNVQLKLIVSTLLVIFGFNNLSALAQSAKSKIAPVLSSVTADIQKQFPSQANIRFPSKVDFTNYNGNKMQLYSQWSKASNGNIAVSLDSQPNCQVRACEIGSITIGTKPNEFNRALLSSPVLSSDKLRRIRQAEQKSFSNRTSAEHSLIYEMEGAILAKEKVTLSSGIKADYILRNGMGSSTPSYSLVMWQQDGLYYSVGRIGGVEQARWKQEIINIARSMANKPLTKNIHRSLTISQTNSASQNKTRKPSKTEIQTAKNNLRQRVQSLKGGSSSHYIKDRRNSKQIQARNALVDSWKQTEPELAPFIGLWSGYESGWSIYPSNTKGKVCVIQGDEENNFTTDIGTIIDGNIYTQKGKVLFKDGNYLGVGKIDNNRFVGINDVPLNSPTALREPVLFKNISGISPSIGVLKPYVDNNCTASSPGKNNYDRTIIGNLSDGNYTYGQLPFPGILGANYISFRKSGNIITGVSSYPHTGGSPCLQGTVKGNSITDVTSINTLIGEPGAKDIINKDELLSLNEYYRVKNQDDTKSIDKCSQKIFENIPQKQFSTVSSRQKEPSPDIEVPNYVEIDTHKFVKGRSGFYFLQLKKNNKCLWVNQKGKLAAFPCEFHDFQRWNLIPILIKKDNSVLYAVNARGTLQCLTKDSSLTSCNNWDNLFFSSFEM